VDIILIGASKKTRLVLDFLEEEGRAAEVLGLVDRDPALRNTIVGGKRVLGDLESVLTTASAGSVAFCICLSERFFSDRIRISTMLSDRGFAATSLISAKADVSRTAAIAAGSIIFPNVRVGMNATVGACVTAYTAALIEHDCAIAANVEIASRAVLAGGVRVGSGSFIGINATVLPNLSIGEGAIVGGGAVVTKHVDDCAVVVGNPAHVLQGQSR
jgi:sugar O-acyltransferase (sialic acid O-acetyltransferase NeuD family)